MSSAFCVRDLLKGTFKKRRREDLGTFYTRTDIRELASFWFDLVRLTGILGLGYFGPRSLHLLPPVVAGS